MSRWDLVNFMAHQDGGAHVDPAGLDDRYSLVLRGGDIAAGFRLPPGKTAIEVGDQVQLSIPPATPRAVSVLHIAHELCASMNEFPDTRHLFE